MLSLRELQTQFATALLDATGEPNERIAIYRNTVFANYRNALGATYPVVRQLVGVPFFNAAVDAYVLSVPSTGGDLNVYGDDFGDFLAAYPHAQDLAYLPDVARLEWAVDEASRAADLGGTSGALLAALATVPTERITAQRFELDPSCRLLSADDPVLRIWQVHQPGFAGDPDVAFGVGTDWLLVRREAGEVVIERLPVGDYALLHALDAGADLALALDAAMSADATFDLGTALRAHIANRAIAQLRVG
jgi:Putative DNA-binding domain